MGRVGGRQDGGECDEHHPALDALQVVGGLLLVLALFRPWTSRGPGSALASHRLGDLLASGALDPLIPRAALLLLYVGPAGGALAALAAGLDGRPRRVLELAGALGAAIAGLLAGALALTSDAPGGGIALTGAGALAVVGAVVGRRLSRRRARRSR
jgi:hypothetical protein